MEKINIDNEPNKNRANEHINYLRQFMTERRIEVLNKVLAERTEYVTLCLENIYHSQNASAVIRTAEAFGLQKVHVIDELLPFEPSLGVVRGTDKWLDIVNHSEKEATKNLITNLKKEGYRIVATSPHDLGKAPEEFDITKGKVAVFMGSEKQGLSETALSMADEYITIPMNGFVESLNISVCTAIILNSLTKKLRKEPSIKWELTQEQRDRLFYKWVLLSVKDYERILLKYEKDKINIK
ncbi:MAG: RNA methyltransferase [Bacteroidetes bacterium]|nr:RNA methyltransferase [Bacteroidota bacterium]